MGLSGSEELPENDHGWDVVENIDVGKPNPAAKNIIYR